MNNTVGVRYQSKITGGNRIPSMTEKIWGYLYKCSVPAFQSRTVEDIRQNGVMVTGIADLDEGLKNDWIKKWITINQMVEYFKRGVPVRVINYNDTKDIYQTVQTHLLNWLDVLRTGLNIGDSPMEDLIAMDQFAATVYPHAKYLYTPEALESALANHITATQRVTIANFFSNYNRGRNPNVTIANPIGSGTNETPTPPERESFAERFRQSVISLRKY